MSIPDPFEQDDAALMAGFLDWVCDEPLSVVATQAERISTLEALTDQLAEALRFVKPDNRSYADRLATRVLCAYEADKEAHR